MLNLYRRIHLFSTLIILLSICCTSAAFAGAYLDSAHGDATNGVDRNSISSLGYAIGNCAHCHEQHASIEGTEPAPVKPGPDNYALFYNNFVNQTDGLCYQCHTDGIITNYSYSYRAGGWTASAVYMDDIQEMFTFTNSTPLTNFPTSHNLSDILTFIQTQAWGYTANSNPCSACHNPHAAQGDPLNSLNPKTAAARGAPLYQPIPAPLALPSEHTNSPWQLWGDDWDGTNGGVQSGVRERMTNYAPGGAYQDPYIYNTAPPAPTQRYEPDSSLALQNGSNLTDTVTFCLSCHSNIVNSSNLGNLTAINWATDVHGAGLARDGNHNKGSINGPYTEASGTNYILSCLDCHEPHGSPNTYLLRPEVNGAQVTPPNPLAAQVITANNSTNNWATFCNACHTVGAGTTGGTLCINANHPTGYPNIDCSQCHYHGSVGTPSEVCAPSLTEF